jgi:CheY-like chemotaxis protein
MSNSVLVVEDHHELGTLIEHLLTQRGYDVRCVHTIHDAVAMLNEFPSTCLALWDPTTLVASGPLIATASRLGIHLATIPIGITASGQTPDGLPIIAKRLTSFEAILSVLRAHCPGVEDRAGA